MFKHLLRQFYLSKAERFGVAGLTLLAAATFIVPEIYRMVWKPDETDFSAFSKQVEAYFSAIVIREDADVAAADPELFHFDPNKASQETFVQLGLSPKVAGAIMKYRERGGRFRSPDDFQKIYTLSESDFERLRPYIRIGATAQNKNREVFKAPAKQPELFAFDPNTAGEQDFLRLGLPRALVSRLLRYREKGGFFFEKSDFRKLYGLAEADYVRLEPYIAITKSEVAVRPVTYSGGSGWAKPVAEVFIDVNAAAPDEWRHLPGIGAARAHKIVRYRDKLGGFTSVNQVAETFDLPDSVFQQIRSRLRTEAPVYRQINLNTVSAEELDAHPYFNFKQSQLIIGYRKQHGNFNSVDDLEGILAFSDRKWLEQVKPYLKVKD